MPKTDQGVNRERYLLIPRVLVFLFRGDEILLIQGAPHKRLWAGKYNGIGGHVEQGEDLLTAARRELLEETGLTCDNLRLAGVMVVDAGENPGVGVFVFRGEEPLGELRESREGTLAWVRTERLPVLPVVADVPLLVEQLRAQKAGDPPFSARSYYDENDQQVVEFIR